MANLLGSDIVTAARDILSEPSNQGRFDDSTMIRFANRAQTAVALRIQWPEGTITINSVGGQQEYGLPPIIKILRVYMAGQRIVPTTIPILEGDQIELFDQTAANFVPQWKAQAATAYPVSSTITAPQFNVPWYPGYRPRFYLRGGNIGFVPAPVGIYPIVIDKIPTPPPIVALGDSTNWPPLFLDALAYKTAETAKQADAATGSPGAAQLALNFRQIHEDEMKQLRLWRQKLIGSMNNAVIPVTYRGFYSAARTGSSDD